MDITSTSVPRQQRRSPFMQLLLKISVLALALFASAGAGLTQIVPDHYIVELSEAAPVEKAATVEDGPRRRAILRDHRSTVLAQQRAARRILALEGATPFESVDTVANALLVRMPEGMASRVERMPGISRIYPVREMKVELERALPLHKVPEGWSRIGGGGRAGEGVKIAIIDSGIDPTHPAFVDPSIPMPEGYPRANNPADLAYASNKVIVARNYLAVAGDSFSTPMDEFGHGTAVSAAAAGVVRDTADGPISGVAPKAWLGSYKVVSPEGTARNDIMLKAIDDAVRDGMDVINLSLGSAIALRPEDDIMTRIAERMTAAGVVLVVAAGNEGNGRFSLGDTAVAPAALSVGATWNSRTIEARFLLGNGDSYRAVPGDGPKPVFPLSAPVFDVAQLDGDGLACSPFPANSLAGQIAFILRGDCFFEEKLDNVMAGGAVGAVVYTHSREPQPIIMSVGGATLPGAMVSYTDGLKIKETLFSSSSTDGQVNFRVAEEVDPRRLAVFSSRGPNTDLSIKPDMVATGVALNTATLDGSYDITQGTSFSAPIVAGAAAVLISARPGLSARHYRSLLINAAEPLIRADDSIAPVQEAGAGGLNLDTSLTASIAAYPTSISFGDTTGGLTRSLTISNLGTATNTFTISPQAFDGGPPPVPSEVTLTLPPGRAGRVIISLNPGNLPGGEYQGYLWIRGPGTAIHVPYWYAVPSFEAAHLNIVRSDEEGSAGGLVRGAISIRVTDSGGIPISHEMPRVTVVSGGGNVVSVYSSDAISPGLFEVTLRLGPSAGDNVFLVEAGGLSKEVTIAGF